LNANIAEGQQDRDDIDKLKTQLDAKKVLFETDL
jgi:hypothetical protein